MALRLLLVVAALASPATAAVRLPALFSDGMVLQRGGDAPVWGTALPGRVVSVRGSWGATASATAGPDGRWRTVLATPGDGGPYELTVDGDDALVVRDVRAGDVWLCSGQSNMDIEVGALDPPPDDVIAAADDRDLRLFEVEKAARAVPRTDTRGTWAAATPDTVRGFSAACWFFGRRLREALHVPIGLVAATVPGTEIEAWASEDALRTVPELRRRIDALPERLTDYEAAYERWIADVDAADAGLRERWFLLRPGRAPAGWTPLPPRPDLEGPGPTLPAGVTWLRAEARIPADVAQRPALLDMGTALTGDRAWVNGTPVVPGRDAGGRRAYALPPGTLAAPWSTVVVRLFSQGDVPPPAVAPYLTRIRAGDVDVAVTGWQERAGVALRGFAWPPRAPGEHHAQLWNGMIAPLVPYALRGVVWYQGEANVARAAQYRETFAAMIADWRRKWARAELPFYFVQLTPYVGYEPPGGIAELRDAQRATLALPHTGMVVTTDVARADDIHSGDKHEIGERLARLALARTYGVADVVATGPLYRAMRVEGGAIRVEFDEAMGGLVAPSGLADFRIAGADRAFRPAEARIDGETVVVRSRGVPAPVAVRFGWEDAPRAELWNRAGLPASPFRTDDWPGVTDGVSWEP